MATQEQNKQTSKKETSKKETSKKQPARKSAAKKDAPRAEPGKRRSGADIAESAARQLADVAGKRPEAVTGLQRTDEGWQVEVEVLELSRVPNTTDVLAAYEVTVDRNGELEGYRRVRRYVRGAAGEDDR